jgi:hypothetical protein
MKTQALEFLPKARSEALITKEVEGEVLVYDRIRDKAHCLNETAARIWKLCDGQTSASDIALILGGSRQTAARGNVIINTSSDGSGADERIVWLALDQLRRSHLLEKPNGNNGKSAWPQAVLELAHMSRREAVRRIGLGAAIALPIVISMTSPTPVDAAASCGAKCKPCSTPVDCCNVCSISSVPGCPASTQRCT